MPLPVKKGDRIAQLILEKCSTPPVAVVDELPATTRYVVLAASVLSRTPHTSHRRPPVYVRRVDTAATRDCRGAGGFGSTGIKRQRTTPPPVAEDAGSDESKK